MVNGKPKRTVMRDDLPARKRTSERKWSNESRRTCKTISTAILKFKSQTSTKQPIVRYNTSMETVQFILDYFFGNFWHYLALLILLIAVGHKGNYIITEIKKKDD
jgi:hypothetical protein